MHAMQKTSSSHQDDDEPETLLKVPKLKLKLSKPFQKLIESEQWSTESDSGSDNDNYNENEDGENGDGVSHELNSNELNHHQYQLQQQTLPFSSDEQQQQEQHHHQQQHEHYPYDANNSVLEMANQFADNANESGSSAKNTSTDSIDERIEQDVDDQYRSEQFENDTSAQPHELHPNDESTTRLDITEHIDTNHASGLNVSILGFFPSPTNQSQNYKKITDFLPN